MTARLIVMDIDSTLINQEVIDLLGEEAGVGEQVAQITERAMRGELDFKQALEERVGLLAGLDESVFERTFARVTFTPGALELVRSAHSKGWKVGVVSGGFHEVADKIVAAAGIDFCLANRLEVVDGKLTGKLAADIVTKESKLIQLLDWAVGVRCRYGPHRRDRRRRQRHPHDSGRGHGHRVLRQAQDARGRPVCHRRAQPDARHGHHPARLVDPSNNRINSSISSFRTILS